MLTQFLYLYNGMRAHLYSGQFNSEPRAVHVKECHCTVARLALLETVDARHPEQTVACPLFLSRILQVNIGLNILLID